VNKRVELSPKSKKPLDPGLPFAAMAMVPDSQTRRYFALLVLALLSLGCDRAKPGPPGEQVARPSTQPVSPLSVAATAKDIDALTSAQGSLTFRSWNGKWIGMDGDTDLTFLPQGAVHMFEYGDAMAEYSGKYTIDADGVVTMSFPKFGQDWPKMMLRRDTASLLLKPTDDRTGLIIGNRGGATIPSDAGGYWPFRPVSVADEHGVMERIKRQENESGR
jgi:hypothetical protein